MRNLKELNLKEKRALVRCDFDVPLDEEGNILDDFRIKQAIPTIEYLIRKEAKVILIGHAGRPDGKIIEKMRLTPIQKKLEDYLGVSVNKSSDSLGQEIEKLTRKMKAGEVLLLENLRFHIEEQENNDKFSKELVKLGDVYINNAFANSHRNHASMAGLPKYLVSAAGLALEKEIEALNFLKENPRAPLVAVIGGKKVESSKLNLINKFSEKNNWVLIGGLVEKGLKEKNIQLKYPQQIIAPVDEVEGKDIGVKTIELFREKIIRAKTVFWNGPLGQIEKEKFISGSKSIAEAIIQSKAYSVVGGGETVKFINRLGFNEKFNHVSTGGGAMLAFLSGEKLAGLEALEKSKNTLYE